MMRKTMLLTGLLLLAATCAAAAEPMTMQGMTQDQKALAAL